MAFYGSHWKWPSVTPSQTPPIEPIEKIGTID